MSSTTASLVQYLGTLSALATVTIVLAVIGDSHAGEALAGTLGFAVSARPIGGGTSSPPIVAAATLGLAGALAVAASGCTGAEARAAAGTSCAIARKLCAAVDGACAAVDTAGSETP